MFSWSRHARTALPHLLPPLALVLALAAVRLEIAHGLDMRLGDALGSGLWRGWYFDLVTTLMVSVVALASWAVLAVPARLAWIGIAAFVWTACASNALYFKFFGISLDWWIVEMHWRDAGMVQGSAAQLGLTGPILSGALLLACGITAALMQRALARRLGTAVRPLLAPWWRERALRLAFAGGLWAVSAVAWNAPKWVSHPSTYAVVLSDNIVRQWLRQGYKSRMYVGVGMEWADELDRGLSVDERRTPSRVLAEFRDLGGEPRAAADPNWPLYVHLASDADSTRALRQRLGLPAAGPIHLIMLFGESMRALELQRPEMATAIFPRLRKLIDERGVEFTQAYSSSFSAGQTVRGQFSTQCSMLPNMLGPAEYIAHTTVRLGCVQEYLKRHGYRTTWFNSHTASYHGKRAFESLHGMDEYYDREFFSGRGITQRIGDWGLADRPVLAATVDKLVELSQDGRPLYANILTISTHHPYSVVPEGPLPPDLVESTRELPEYAGFLSRFRYSDDAEADFIEALFNSPIGDNTVIVLLGDHGSPVAPHFELGPVQRIEMQFRIPLALLTKHLPSPEKLHHPVHQIDIVPTLARLVGLSTETTWLGRDLFTGGSPWLYVTSDLLHYRVGPRACYTLPGHDAPTCYDLSGLDPLLTEPSKPLPANDDEVRFFRRVAQATMRAVALNALAPPAVD
jgi:hypothetical protein